MIVSWKDIDFYKELSKDGYLEKVPRKRKPSPLARDMLNVMMAFDIETSTVVYPKEKKIDPVNAHAFMYVWQLQINDYTVMGRTWDEAMDMFLAIAQACIRIRKENRLEELPTVICWVHSLAYEFQFLSGIYPFKTEECFFRDVRKPIYCRMFNCIEMRCSYMQTNMSLKHLTIQMGVKEKLSGQKYNYEIIRYPWTPLTEYEKEYCATDVQSLLECMKLKMHNDHDTVHTVPLTSTGYVRRDCLAALKPLYMDIKEILPDIEQYKLMRSAFRGGNTHCNRKYSRRILKKVYSYDMSSCYPAQQLTKRFPMSRFKWIDDRLTMERVFRFIGLGYAVIGRYQFKNLRLKHRVPIPYISLAKTDSKDFKLDNGRILEAGYSEMAITEIDLMIILDQYTFDEMNVMTAMVAQKHYLPEEYRKVIQKYYEDKTRLKGASDPETEYLYFKSKEKLNGIYGMSAQDPIHSEILYIDGEYKRSNYDSKNAEKLLLSAKFPYQWGVYTTSYARAALQEAIDIAGRKMVYCDTDSIKTDGPINLDRLNEKRQNMALSAGAFADDSHGERHYMGVFELDAVYDRFVTCGAKRYAYEKNGKLGVTVSGVSKALNEKTKIAIAAEELGCLENFKEDFEWHKAAGTMAVYNDTDDTNITDPATGKVVQCTKNVALVPTTYKMTYSRDYKLLMKEIDLYGEYKSMRE